MRDSIKREIDLIVKDATNGLSVNMFRLYELLDELELFKGFEDDLDAKEKEVNIFFSRYLTPIGQGQNHLKNFMRVLREML